jgi:DNA-binding Lrp family transcriptional regulator
MTRKINDKRLHGAENHTELDALDVQILDLMVTGDRSKEIAQRINRPLSTVQRRMRQLFESGAVSPSIDLNYGKLGLKKGQLSVYVSNGNIGEIASKLTQIQGVLDVSIHIGNSDVIVMFMYKNSSHLLEFTSSVRDILGVERVVWSEELYRLPVKEARKIGSVMNYVPRAIDGMSHS